MLANHKPGWIRKRGIKVNLNRGDIGYSERELAKRWKWSRNKVRRFMNELCSGDDPELEQQTIPQNKNVTSCYSIRKYNDYQGEGTAERATEGPQKGHKRYQNNNDKNEKNKDIYVGTFFLKDGSEFGIDQELYDYFKKIYPDVDLKLEFQKISGWCFSNPSKRKTRKGAKRFLNSWLSSAQEKVLKNKPHKEEPLTGEALVKKVYGE